MQVKFYPYKNRGGGRKHFSHAEGQGHKMFGGSFNKGVLAILNPLRARNALRQHFRMILYTLESAS